MNVLVTGHAGYIGCILVPMLRRAGHAVTGLDSGLFDGCDFSAPELGVREDATSAATPAFWQRAGFTVAVDDERFPVMRREL